MMQGQLSNVTQRIGNRIGWFWRKANGDALADQRQIRQKIKRDRFLKVNKYFVIIEIKSCSLKLEHPQNCEASI